MSPDSVVSSEAFVAAVRNGRCGGDGTSEVTETRSGGRSASRRASLATLAAANVSSEASRLRATLNKIVNHDLSHDTAITPLLQTLVSLLMWEHLVRPHQHQQQPARWATLAAGDSLIVSLHAACQQYAASRCGFSITRGL